jgi:alpha-glucosidase
MPWTGEPGAGFTTGRPWLRIGPDATHRNVAAEEADEKSVLAAYRRLLTARRSVAALRRGSYESLDAGAVDVFAWRRVAGRSRAIVAVNFAAEDRRIRLPAGEARRVVAGTHLDPPSPDADDVVSLRPFEGVILAEG